MNRPTNNRRGMSIRSLAVNTYSGDTDEKRRRQSVLPPALRSYECHFNWTQLVPLSVAEMELALWVLDEKFSDERLEIKDLLQSCALKLIAKKTTQAFLHIEMKKISKALINLEEAELFVAECLERRLFYEDYADGCRYIFNGLQMYIRLDRDIKEPTSQVIRFSKLPSKGKVAIWAFRDYFLEDCSRAKVQSFDFLEKMLSLEPCRIRWHFYVYKAMRERNKFKLRRSSSSSIYNSEGKKFFDPISISYKCFCLAEILNSAKEHQYPTRFAKTIIENAQHLIEMLRNFTLQIFREECELGLMEGAYLNLSELYMSSLREPFRDYDLALRCVTKVLELNPNSSLAHHRKGILQFKKQDHKSAVIHLREAIKEDTNIGALYGLIQILMSEPNKNAPEILSLFKTSMTNPKLPRVWDKRCLRTLHYLKGCFHFMQEKEEEAITSWIIAHDNGSEKWSYYFLNLAYQSFRFGWPTKRLNLANVSDTLKHVAYIEQTQFKQVLLDICLEVDDAIRRYPENSWESLKNHAH